MCFSFDPSLYIFRKSAVVLLKSNINLSTAIFTVKNFSLFWRLFWLQKIYSVSTIKRSGFHDLSYYHKQLKTMEVKEVWHDVYINSNLHQNRKCNSSCKSTKFKTQRPSQSEFPNSGKDTLEQRLDLEERNNTKEYGCDSNSCVSR